MTLMHTSTAFLIRDQRVRENVAAVTSASLVHCGDTRLPDASRRTRRAVRRRRSA